MEPPVRPLTRWWTAFALAASLAHAGRGARVREVRRLRLVQPSACKQREVYWAPLAIALIADPGTSGQPPGRGRRRIAAFLLAVVFATGAITAVFHTGARVEVVGLARHLHRAAATSASKACRPAPRRRASRGGRLLRRGRRGVFLGLSMAGWNALISPALAVFSLLAAKRPSDARAPR